MPERPAPSQFEVIHQHESDITIIGSGRVGDKSARLVEETPNAREVGFRTPPRLVLAQDILDAWIQEAGIGDGIEALTYAQGSQIDRNQQLHRLIRASVGAYNIPVDNPLGTLVRSSGPSDRRGINKHQSVLTVSDPNHVTHAIVQVMASYTEPKALEHRRKVGSDHGYGILIEPHIAVQASSVQDRATYAAPLLSGYGQTITPDEPTGYIGVVPGFGAGVTSGAHIFRLSDYPESVRMVEALAQERDDIRNGEKPARISNLLKNQRDFHYADAHYYGGALQLSDGNSPRGTIHTDMPLQFSPKDIQGLNAANLHALHSMARELAAGRRLYYEWAAIPNEENYVDFWLTQVGELNMPIDTIDFSQTEGLFAQGTAIFGTGERKAKSAVLLSTFDDVMIFLGDGYNYRNTNYCVFLHPTVVASAPYYKIGFEQFSNAAGIFEWNEGYRTHGRPLASHFEGELDEYNIVFGEVRTKPILPFEKNGGIEVYNGDLLIKASQARQKLALYRIPEEQME